MNFRRKLAIVAVPAVLVLAGGAVAVHAALPPAPAPKAAATEADPVERTGAETPAAAEATEAAETPEVPGATETGHADDPADPNVDHQGTDSEP